MCVPLAAAAIASTALSAGIGAYGSIMQGNATNAADRYQATIAQDSGLAAENATRMNEQATYRQGDQAASLARAAAAASGVNVNSGTAFLNQGDIRRQTQQNVNNQTYNAELATWQGENQSSLLRTEGSQAQTAGYIGAGSTLIGGAGQIASKWLNLNGPGSSPNPGGVTN